MDDALAVSTGLPADREPAPGEVIRHGARTYVVGERIAGGKFGSTFACRDDWGYPRILRDLRPFSRAYESVRETWIEQAAALQRLQHPDRVHLLDSCEHDGRFLLVSERCDYRLDRCLASPAWDGSRWFRTVARPVLCALEHLHAAGYVHQNLHPRNVLLPIQLERLHPDAAVSGAVKLADLEVNTLLGRVDVLNAKLPRWLVPPEYLNPSDFGPLDHRVDIYQAGLLLLCILTGRIARYSFADVATGLPAKTAEGLASDRGPILARALRVNVAERFPSALELWQALDGAPPTPSGCLEPAAAKAGES